MPSLNPVAPSPTDPGNSIFAIRLYRLGRVWAFDDPSREIFAEPFVAGMTEMLDHAATESIGPFHGPEITVTFSRQPFPGARFTLEGEAAEAGGRWYRLAGTDQRGWLCPAVLKYFPEHPDALYGQVTP